MDYVKRIGAGAYSSTEKELDSFDKVGFNSYQLTVINP